MLQESFKKGFQPFVFEKNDSQTWNKIRSAAESFLTAQYRNGGLAGAKPSDSFYVKVGLGQTMTQNDIDKGRMIIETGVAVLKPAEFITLRIALKMT
jgi:phage tail sheath protein FI